MISSTTTPVIHVPEFTFDKAKHVYTLDGRPLTGVTTILGVIGKPFLINWAANMVAQYIKDHCDVDEEGIYDVSAEQLEKAKTAHTRKKEEAGAAGTAVHEIIEGIIKNAIDNNNGYLAETSHENKQVNNFLEWANGTNVRFLDSEKRLYSAKHWYAGTADIICEIDGQKYIGDIKTSSGIYPEHFIQCAAYAEAAKEMGLYDNFHGVIILNCKKNGGFESAQNFDMKGNFDCFLAALTIYRHLNKITK